MFLILANSLLLLPLYLSYEKEDFRRIGTRITEVVGESADHGPHPLACSCLSGCPTSLSARYPKAFEEDYRFYLKHQFFGGYKFYNV